MRRVFFALVLPSVVVLLGCAQHGAVMFDPDGNAVVTHRLYTFLQEAVQWIIPGVLVVLGSAAYIHWRITPRRYLLMFAVAAFMMAVGLVAGQFGQRPMWGATMEEIASGRRAPIQWLMTAQQILTALGFVIAGGSGVVALISGVRQLKQSSTGSSA